MFPPTRENPIPPLDSWSKSVQLFIQRGWSLSTSVIRDQGKAFSENDQIVFGFLTDPALAENGVVLVKFSLAQGTSGTISVTLDDPTAVTFAGGRLANAKGELLAAVDGAWKWERQRLVAALTADNAATLAIATRPLTAAMALTVDYDAQRAACADTWQKILATGMKLETPEPRVNNAWRHLLIQNIELINGDLMHYSAGNQYDKLYEAEGSDAALAMLAWGRAADMRRLMTPLLDFTRKGLEYHQAGFKIMNVCRYFWQTRDAATFRALQPKWEKEAQRIIENRTGPHGLFPPERYAGDISTPTQPVNANAHARRRYVTKVRFHGGFPPLNVTEPVNPDR